MRFIRYNGRNWGVNPDHLGISGSSAGGHLSLTMGTQGGPGKADAKDPIDRESSAVQAVACFFPPTDFPEPVERYRRLRARLGAPKAIAQSA